MPLIKLIENKIIKIINEWIPSKPLKPSIRFDPLIINRKHKPTNTNENISITKRLSKNSRPVLWIYKLLDIIKIIKKAHIIINLNLGGIFNFKSSIKPKRKKKVQKDKYSKIKTFLKKYKYKKTTIGV